MNNPTDIEFGFEIGLKPEYTLAEIAKANVTLHTVKATDAMVDEEINRMQIKGGNMTEPETIENDENVLNILFTEADKDGSIIEGRRKQRKFCNPEIFNCCSAKKIHG